MAVYRYPSSRRVLSKQGMLWLIVSVVLPSCAIDYVDDQGVRHVVGLAAVRIPPPERMGQACLHGASVEAVGIAAYDNGVGAGVGLGYVNESMTIAYECRAVVGDLQK